MPRRRGWFIGDRQMAKQREGNGQTGSGGTAVQDRPERPETTAVTEAGTGGGGLAQLGQTTPATRRQSGAGGDLDLAVPPILVPHIEVQQCRGELVVRADMPGLRPEDINVSVDHGVLTISGERQEEHREERDGFVR